MAGVRKDVATLGGPWSSEILWYARAVQALSARAPADPTSWAYLAAIHGIDPAGWASASIIPSISALPPQQIQDVDFNQCQHAGWFFLPWHRGYLAAFEAILADWIAGQPNAPTDWALPYWNYLDATNATARSMPAEFLSTTWPGVGPNPLLAPRSGTSVLGPQPWLGRADINLNAQTTPMPYTAAPGTQGYGGAISGFASEGDLTGAVEGNPHNTVHVMIGGLGSTPGWMSDPSYAALDPIFWLHHCNIDRFWAAWMSVPGNVQERSSAWANGPFPRQFTMPDPSGKSVVFVPGDTLPGGPLAPTYDNLYIGTGIPRPATGVVAMSGALPTGAGGKGGGSGGSGSGAGGGGGGSSLVGANDSSLTVSSAPVSTRVAIDAGPSRSSPFSMTARKKGERYYLNLEGVRGEAASGALNVSIKPPGSARSTLVETVTLFGLARASSTEGRHGGNGLSIAIEITDEVKAIQSGPITPDALGVEISQPGGIATPITVDRVSIYKKPAD